MPDEKMLRDALEACYRVVTNGVAMDKKVGSVERSKIKELGEALRHMDDPEAGVLHFVKHAEYFLPRSNMYRTLEELLNVVVEFRKVYDGEDLREVLRYTVGYIAWTLDAVENIRNKIKDQEMFKNMIEKMVHAEFRVVNLDRADYYSEKLIKWISGGEGR